MFSMKVNWEIMDQLIFNVSHHDHSGEIVPSKGFEKIIEVRVKHYLRSTKYLSTVLNTHTHTHTNALLIEIFVIATQPHIQF